MQSKEHEYTFLLEGDWDEMLCGGNGDTVTRYERFKPTRFRTHWSNQGRLIEAKLLGPMIIKGGRLAPKRELAWEFSYPTFSEIPEGIAQDLLAYCAADGLYIPGMPGRSKAPDSTTEPAIRPLAKGRGSSAHESRDVIDEALEAAELGDPPADVDELEDWAAPEGKRRERIHFAYERNRRLREAKIRDHLRTNESLTCLACGFDFTANYGERGVGYIEVHHVVPLHAFGERVTTLGDLALLCSNCHRMIHRGNPWLTPEELLDLVSVNYDESSRLPSCFGVQLRWRRTTPPEGYDLAYETQYVGGVTFRAIRSCNGATWRLERQDREADYSGGGISHEASLIACKKRIENGITEGAYFAEVPSASNNE